MTEIREKIGFIGTGNMGEAIIKAIITSSQAEASSIYIYDINFQKTDAISRQYAVITAADSNELFNKCDIVILAVKPQDISKLLIQITEHKYYKTDRKKRKLVVSIAAGISIKKIEDVLYKGLDAEASQNLPIIRVMPNTPALVFEGISAMSPNAYVNNEDIKAMRSILEAMGKVIEFEEEYLDAVTAISGSGPAYIFYLAESMIEAGINLGFEPSDAIDLTLSTMKGAVKLMENTNESPESLCKKVTSPGGTTEAAFKVLKANSVKQNIIKAIEAAAKRASALSKFTAL